MRFFRATNGDLWINAERVSSLRVIQRGADWFVVANLAVPVQVDPERDYGPDVTVSATLSVVVDLFGPAHERGPCVDWVSDSLAELYGSWST